jgi:hypothetical protein
MFFTNCRADTDPSERREGENDPDIKETIWREYLHKQKRHAPALPKTTSTFTQPLRAYESRRNQSPDR